MTTLKDVVPSEVFTRLYMLTNKFYSRHEPVDLVINDIERKLKEMEKLHIHLKCLLSEIRHYKQKKEEK